MPFTVLVIDDDEDTRSNLRDVLELDGYRIEMAGSVAETLNRQSWEQIGAVLLDRKLPDGTAGLLTILSVVMIVTTPGAETSRASTCSGRWALSSTISGRSCRAV